MIDIAFILVLVLINGVFSMSELAMFSARMTRLQQLSRSGDLTARRALAIREHPTRFLSTVQVGITLVGVLAGAVGGATLTEQLAAHLGAISWIAPYREQVALGIIVLAVTYVSVVFGELIPKRLALLHSEALACAVALASLDLFRDEPVLERVQSLERWLKAGLAPLSEIPLVGDVRVLGGVGILELVSDRASRTAGGYLDGIGPRLTAAFLERGVLIRPLGNVLYLMPPYVISESETAWLIDQISAVLRDASKGGLVP